MVANHDGYTEELHKSFKARGNLPGVLSYRVFWRQMEASEQQLKQTLGRPSRAAEASCFQMQGTPSAKSGVSLDQCHLSRQTKTS